MQMTVMRIEGTVAMPDMRQIEVNGEVGYEIPEMDSSYYLACQLNDVLLVSKDGTDFVIGLAVQCMGERFSAPDAIKILKEAETMFSKHSEGGETNEQISGHEA